MEMLGARDDYVVYSSTIDISSPFVPYAMTPTTPRSDCPTPNVAPPFYDDCEAPAYQNAVDHVAIPIPCVDDEDARRDSQYQSRVAIIIALGCLSIGLCFLIGCVLLVARLKSTYGIGALPVATLSPFIIMFVLIIVITFVAACAYRIPPGYDIVDRTVVRPWIVNAARPLSVGAIIVFTTHFMLMGLKLCGVISISWPFVYLPLFIIFFVLLILWPFMFHFSPDRRYVTRFTMSISSWLCLIGPPLIFIVLLCMRMTSGLVIPGGGTSNDSWHYIMLPLYVWSFGFLSMMRCMPMHERVWTVLVFGGLLYVEIFIAIFLQSGAFGIEGGLAADGSMIEARDGSSSSLALSLTPLWVLISMCICISCALSADAINKKEDE